MRVLAVDIGGSKIDILYHDGFKTLFKRFSWGLKHRDLSKSIFNTRFNKLMKYILAEYAFDQVVFSVAGLDSHEDWIFWRGKLDQYIRDRYILVHDVKAALYTATLGLDGIVVIIGTGCNVYGEYGGRAYYSGGLFRCEQFRQDFVNYLCNRELKVGEYVKYPIVGGLLIPYIEAGCMREYLVSLKDDLISCIESMEEYI